MITVDVNALHLHRSGPVDAVVGIGNRLVMASAVTPVPHLVVIGGPVARKLAGVIEDAGIIGPVGGIEDGVGGIFNPGYIRGKRLGYGKKHKGGKG
jgi:hypothetical protein